MDASLVYITVENGEKARYLGRALVESRLAACANVFEGMTPIYWWDGQVEEGSEAVLIAKTRTSLVERLTAFVKERHDYDCPCVVALPVTGGNGDFLNWIAKETAEA